MFRNSDPNHGDLLGFCLLLMSLQELQQRMSVGLYTPNTHSKTASAAVNCTSRQAGQPQGRPGRGWSPDWPLGFWGRSDIS